MTRADFLALREPAICHPAGCRKAQELRGCIMEAAGKGASTPGPA
jgi:hypothetical protein